MTIKYLVPHIHKQLTIIFHGWLGHRWRIDIICVDRVIFLQKHGFLFLVILLQWRWVCLFDNNGLGVDTLLSFLDSHFTVDGPEFMQGCYTLHIELFLLAHSFWNWWQANMWWCLDTSKRIHDRMSRSGKSRLTLYRAFWLLLKRLNLAKNLCHLLIHLNLKLCANFLLIIKYLALHRIKIVVLKQVFMNFQRLLLFLICSCFYMLFGRVHIFHCSWENWARNTMVQIWIWFHDLHQFLLSTLMTVNTVTFA